MEKKLTQTNPTKSWWGPSQNTLEIKSRERNLEDVDWSSTNIDFSTVYTDFSKGD